MAASDKKFRDQTVKNSPGQKDLEGSPDIDHGAEARLVRKLDYMIVPPVMLLYLFSFLDRV